MELNIKTVPHTGVTKASGRKETVQLPFDRVYIDGRMIGYLPRRDNATFLPLTKMKADDATPIVRALDELRNSEGTFRNVVGFGVGAPNEQDVSRAFDAVDAEETQIEEYDDE